MKCCAVLSDCRKYTENYFPLPFHLILNSVGVGEKEWEGVGNGNFLFFYCAAGRDGG